MGRQLQREAWSLVVVKIRATQWLGVLHSRPLPKALADAFA